MYINKVTCKKITKPKTEKIYKSNKYIEMHVEKYLFEIRKEYIKKKNRNM